MSLERARPIRTAAGPLPALSAASSYARIRRTHVRGGGGAMYRRLPPLPALIALAGVLAGGQGAPAPRGGPHEPP
ncbi:MAG: hypothetical protein OXF01_16250, partial [Gemmatimonadetes bacterium]|nr:hypothetical protein [Gemmatimonadota bacterium]